VGQIRYCLSEKIRLDAEESRVTGTSRYAIAQFNGAVDDYNSRCAQFRYRQDDLDAAQSVVDARQADVKSEGDMTAAKWLREYPGKKQPKPTVQHRDWASTGALMGGGAH
jgi:hypothetical protein